ncbi:MAG: 5'/3'-nucleotidase SurE [Proteobacteria bacterium]|nr:5'/3'-nucleotidase SurE [Pseudomonadota bacterium]
MTWAPPSFERILVTNDDGIEASGLKLLEDIAGALSDEVWVIAPQSEQSGAGHSLTLSEPMRIRRLNRRRFAISGTPTDSVMLALNHIMKDQPPTLLLSGINRGVNLAEDLTYSGTVAAAFEGSLAGVPSLALSQERRRDQRRADWEVAAAHTEVLLRDLVAAGWPEGVCLNINFPSAERGPLKGRRVTCQGRRDLGRLRVDERLDPRGFPYYWFDLRRDGETSAEASDLWAVQNGWVSITPLHLDLTHKDTLAQLTARLDQD